MPVVAFNGFKQLPRHRCHSLRNPSCYDPHHFILQSSRMHVWSAISGGKVSWSPSRVWICCSSTLTMESRLHRNLWDEKAPQNTSPGRKSSSFGGQVARYSSTSTSAVSIVKCSLLAESPLDLTRRAFYAILVMRKAKTETSRWG